MRLDDRTIRAALTPVTGEWRSEQGLRDSAVLVPIVLRGGDDLIVFNRRRDDLPWHAGQVCFPGGARHGAESAIECALRETAEEMGLEARDVTVLGRLPDRVSIAGFRVAVFAGRIDPASTYRLRESEVAEAFEVPFVRALEPARWSWRDATKPSARFRRVPAFDSGRHEVWGLTGIILRDFVCAVSGFEPADPGDTRSTQ